MHLRKPPVIVLQICKISLKMLTFRIAAILLLLSSVLTAEADKKLHFLHKHRHPRMAFAYEARPLQFPWHVSISFWGSDSKKHYCGGSLISDRWVLTAAHCVYDKREITLGFGSNNLFKPELQMQSRTFKTLPMYSPLKSLYDMALVELPRKVIFSDNIQPIKLPTMFPETETFEGCSAELSGFGRIQEEGAVSEKLLWAPMRVISNDDCAKTFGRTKIFPSILCTVGSDDYRHSPCPGDSGGSLVVYENTTNSWVMIGVMAFMYPNSCTSGKPAGYMRVTFLQEWINDVLKR